MPKPVTTTPRILFLCTGNSCRSQIAEGLMRHRFGDAFTVASAGIEAHGLNPLAVEVMQEIGIDISMQLSKTLDELPDLDYDLVVTVCDNAQENCPVFPGRARVRHRSFDDPPRLAAAATSKAEALPHYRRVRDEIDAFVRELPERLIAAGKQGRSDGR